MQSCLKVSNTMVFLPFTLDVVTNKTCFTQETKRNRVCLQVWSKPTNNNNNNNSAFKKGKMFISFPRFFVFLQLDKFPVVQTNHHFKVCHFYDVLLVCEFRYASRTQSKCFSSCFCYLNVLNRSCFEVLSDRVKSLQSLIFNTRSVHRPSTKKCDQVPRCKLSKQRCTSFPHNLSQRSLYFLKCS